MLQFGLQVSIRIIDTNLITSIYIERPLGTHTGCFITYILIFLIPDYKIRQRHDLLARTIGVKQEEEASLYASNTLVISMTVSIVVISILESALYLFYNRMVI